MKTKTTPAADVTFQVCTVNPSNDLYVTRSMGKVEAWKLARNYWASKMFKHVYVQTPGRIVWSSRTGAR